MSSRMHLVVPFGRKSLHLIWPNGFPSLSTRSQVRNVFRRQMGARPEQWDWASAHVPSALNDEAEAERDEKERAKAHRNHFDVGS